jgi:hypothetical protein
MNKQVYTSHYDFLETNLRKIAEEIGEYRITEGYISSHGDKCYSYKDRWEAKGIKFPHGVFCYLLSYLHPESRGGDKDVCDWVSDICYPRYKNTLEKYPCPIWDGIVTIKFNGECETMFGVFVNSWINEHCQDKKEQAYEQWIAGSRLITL